MGYLDNLRAFKESLAAGKSEVPEPEPEPETAPVKKRAVNPFPVEDHEPGTWGTPVNERVGVTRL